MGRFHRVCVRDQPGFKGRSLSDTMGACDAATPGSSTQQPKCTSRDSGALHQIQLRSPCVARAWPAIGGDGAGAYRGRSRTNATKLQLDDVPTASYERRKRKFDRVGDASLYWMWRGAALNLHPLLQASLTLSPLHAHHKGAVLRNTMPKAVRFGIDDSWALLISEPPLGTGVLATKQFA